MIDIELLEYEYNRSNYIDFLSTPISNSLLLNSKQILLL